MKPRPRCPLSAEALESRRLLAVGTAAVPAAPRNLAVAAVSASEIGLVWELGDAADTGVVIERRTDADGAFATLAVLTAGETIYTDTGLDIRNCSSGNSFTDVDGTRRPYGAVGAGVYLERCDHATIAACTIHDHGEGIFGAGLSTDRLMTDILVDSNSIYGNGNAGSEREHNTDIEAVDTTCQFNRYGPLRAGVRGAGLKDRSAGTVIRGNWIEGGSTSCRFPRRRARRTSPWPCRSTASRSRRATRSSRPLATARARSGSAATRGLPRGIARASSPSTTTRWWPGRTRPGTGGSRRSWPPRGGSRGRSRRARS